MKNIHPTAIVSPEAKIGENIEVGPYAIIEADVEIGDNCKVGPHACIYDGARIGNNVKILQAAAVSNIPQDLKFDPDFKSQFYIGDNTTIREFATLHRGTEDLGYSKIGSNCLVMAYAHVAHDCIIGNNCIIVNSVQVGGHARIEDYAIIGGSTPVHQFSKIGAHVMIGGGLRVVSDVPPFIMAAGEPLRFGNVNIVGLRRRGFTNDQISNIKDCYKLLYKSGMNTTQAKEAMMEKYPDDECVAKIVEFINNSDRGIIKG